MSRDEVAEEEDNKVGERDDEVGEEEDDEVEKRGRRDEVEVEVMKKMEEGDGEDVV